jgi:predicted amidophosphoribosyltransferase
LSWINVATPAPGHSWAMQDDHRQPAPLCPRCRQPMAFVGSVPKIGALPELRTYQCKPCRETVTEADEPPASWAQPSDATHYSPRSPPLPEEGCC